MKKKNFKLELWQYDGTHENGKDTIHLDELPELAKTIGVPICELHEAIDGLSLHQSFKLNGRKIRLTRQVIGKSDGFGSEIKETYTIES